VTGRADWRATWSVMTGKGINRQIRRAYEFWASGCRPGDLAVFWGVVAKHLCSLLARRFDRPRGAFASLPCRCAHRGDGVWESVKSLGVRLPSLGRLSVSNHAVQSHTLSERMKSGFHALAGHERISGSCRADMVSGDLRRCWGSTPRPNFGEASHKVSLVWLVQTVPLAAQASYSQRPIRAVAPGAQSANYRGDL